MVGDPLAGLALVVLAIVIDLMIGDPRSLPHPVVLIGRFISAFERLWNRGVAQQRRVSGFLLTTIVVGGVWGISWLALALLERLHPGLALIAELWLLSTTLAIKGLGDAARAVVEPLTKGDLPSARKALGMIVGRDTHSLDEAEITRGTVETVAENTVDGITAPLFFALIGGAPLALAYKAVNTLDSMVGYKNQRYADFGFASAKLDDLANWIPARLTALCLWLAGLLLDVSGVLNLRWKGALNGTCRDAPRHPSPNAGWPEAMVARLLGVQLGGTNYYQGVVSQRATLGEPLEVLQVTHITAAVRLMHGAWLLFMVLSVVVIAALMLIRGLL
ncbi:MULTISPECIES: adenosylcobinamide-phosphate synthase CbiB [unclassified Halomonas]|uniref:adenosylcobinamide-phosphate synthase CbiB n=1 Tax=unclassified Halomonas TaxID=2609666 RepID=UPI0007D8FEAC|nr:MULTISPECIES: adenosylcobinamide-phosphate synthase CbiB [unclassified Halomonas]MBT2788452.1 cobalamin biosynthesis protein CobD [Halomonas sp. ISL-106]MBT2798043.1 cobalamin biosynthesis protein CobD [Halomonas sp. ISL-104]OAL60874.1 cobalamin biosynthesis protein CobD [Halomonas sp. ALS9]